MIWFQITILILKQPVNSHIETFMGTSGNMEAREGGKEERSALKFRGLLRFLKWVRESDQSGPRPMRGGSLGCVRGKDYLEVDSEELLDFGGKNDRSAQGIQNWSLQISSKALERGSLGIEY